MLFDLFCELLLQMPRAFVGRLSPPRQTSLRSPSAPWNMWSQSGGVFPDQVSHLSFPLVHLDSQVSPELGLQQLVC